MKAKVKMSFRLASDHAASNRFSRKDEVRHATSLQACREAARIDKPVVENEAAEKLSHEYTSFTTAQKAFLNGAFALIPSTEEFLPANTCR